MWALGFVLIVVLLFWYGNARSNDARRRGAVSFEFDEPDGYVRWIVNFQRGRLFFRWEPPHDPDPSDRNRNLEYELRREGAGQWSMRLTDESWGRALQHARADAKSEMPTVEEGANRRLQELGDSPEWGPISPHLAAVIENRYQTYAEVFGIHS